MSRGKAPNKRKQGKSKGLRREEKFSLEIERARDERGPRAARDTGKSCRLSSAGGKNDGIYQDARGGRVKYSDRHLVGSFVQTKPAWSVKPAPA